MEVWRRMVKGKFLGFGKNVVLSGAPQNFVLYSEEMDNVANWFPGQLTVTANTTVAPDATTTGDTLDVTGDFASHLQIITVTANTLYTFSFYAMSGTATSVYYSVYDNTNAADIVARTNYYSAINGSTWTRVTVSFTTPASCVSAIVYPNRSLTERGTTKVWGVQLNQGTLRVYTKTTGSIVP